MSYLYVVENGAHISISENYVKVQYREDSCRRIPIETLESISIFSKAQMTTQCTEECLRRGIPVAYYSKVGSYFGRLESTGHIRVERQRKQAELYNSEFALELGKRILQAKIKNQEVVLLRYARSKGYDLTEEIRTMNISAQKLDACTQVEQLMGYEGTASDTGQ